MCSIFLFKSILYKTVNTDYMHNKLPFKVFIFIFLIFQFYHNIMTNNIVVIHFRRKCKCYFKNKKFKYYDIVVTHYRHITKFIFYLLVIYLNILIPMGNYKDPKTYTNIYTKCKKKI